MRINEPLGQTSEVLPSKIRWLAIVAACIAGIAGFFSVGPLLSLIASIQILGAIVQPHSPRLGRWLLWVGTSFLSLYVFVLVAPQVIEGIRMVRLYGDRSSYEVFSISLVSVVLIIWCDTALLIDAWRLRCAPRAAKSRLAHSGDWIVRFAAICLSILVFPTCVISALAYRRTGNLNMVLLPLTFGLVVAFFDVVLIRDGLKTRGREFA